MSTVVQIAGWWARDYVYAVGRQLRAAVSRVSPDEFLSGTGRPVVVIPGIFEDWRFMLPLIRELHKAGHPVHVVTVLQRNRLAVPKAAALIADYLQQRDLRDTVIVAHSKGGLIGKYAMMSLDRSGASAGWWPCAPRSRAPATRGTCSCPACGRCRRATP